LFITKEKSLGGMFTKQETETFTNPKRLKNWEIYHSSSRSAAILKAQMMAAQWCAVITNTVGSGITLAALI